MMESNAERREVSFAELAPITFSEPCQDVEDFYMEYIPILKSIDIKTKIFCFQLCRRSEQEKDEGQ